MGAAIDIKNLNKGYQNFDLSEISFSVPKGTIVGLIGENGAGKTTTLKAILNLIEYDSGDITIFDTPSTSIKKISEEIGVVFDDLCFHENLTINQLGNIMQGMYKKWNSDLFRKYCNQFLLDDKKLIGELSRGMKTKLSITIALSHQPKLLILDEATSGLDPVMRDDILDIFLDFIQDENHAVLLSTHITSDLEKVADYIVFIHHGKLIFSLAKDVLLYQYGILRCTTEVFNQINQEDILVYRKKEFEWEILVADKERVARKYRNCVIDNATIDDIMLLYIKGVKP